MSEPRVIQNFIGYRATIATEQPAAIEQLLDMLAKLGISSAAAEINDCKIQIDPSDKDVLFIDSDLNVTVETGASEPSRCLPVIGIIGVEAPSRLRSLMQLGATATLRKPVHRATVYSALFVGINEFRRRRYLADRVEEYERRRLLRRSLVRAVLIVMQRTGSDHAAAYDHLRRESMRSRQSIEEFCASFVQAHGPDLDEAEPPIGTGLPYAKKL
ncbi:ANTAR domain-containing protein [Mesorhizobium sp. CA13]|uniref:ANTAR domain-containing response regulator n=2 Tax=Mesorhizobium TaxID=68287 RepID=UPI00112CD920|nr:MULTISPECIES: ANTAR domain-containing protein [unclassified Mesorhizobium]MBZ9856443.1 ANTAR domain-containing protein [Mesorhizobium sp. CA13]MBZ9965809.1 ANTAR domain-containing protein [Mesorhizobium sp. BR1-1-2]MCA0011927.1 ANTAR domain-containing protein [Mesorhizobium sp. B294B1A1]MCA0038181.1 ANTAR domain-containing protein [Mesorhizobium sp. B292B1B]TPM44087.1 ANTAR domain-containing protein [Mesorhizobium sp. B2-3-2]